MKVRRPRRTVKHYIFNINHSHQCAPMDLNEPPGGKGADLAEMTAVIELPMPRVSRSRRRRVGRGWHKRMSVSS